MQVVEVCFITDHIHRVLSHWYVSRGSGILSRHEKMGKLRIEGSITTTTVERMHFKHTYVHIDHQVLGSQVPAAWTRALFTYSILRMQFPGSPFVSPVNLR